MNNISTPLIESQVFDKLNVVFCYKTDTNINVMSTVSFEKFKLPTGSCFVSIPDLNRL